MRKTELFNVHISRIPPLLVRLSVAAPRLKLFVTSACL